MNMDAIDQYNLGQDYADGDGVPKDYAKAVKWYRLAAEQGLAVAQFNLGYCYANGEGVLKDEAEAVKWYRLAAEQGDADAQFTLGYMYANGEGVPKDSAEAVKWFRLAAEQGDADAQFTLGLRYADGDGVPKDYAKAVKWYRLAADQGDAIAQSNLGGMYERGEGVPKDLVQAHVWFNIAGADGDKDARKQLAKVEKKMTDSQKEKAMDLARELFAKLPKQEAAADAEEKLGILYENESVFTFEGSGSDYDNLADAVDQLLSGNSDFLIITDTRDTSTQTYLQFIRSNPVGRFYCEYRAGSEATHAYLKRPITSSQVRPIVAEYLVLNKQSNWNDVLKLNWTLGMPDR